VSLKNIPANTNDHPKSEKASNSNKVLLQRDVLAGTNCRDSRDVDDNTL